jgi:MshEN domain
VVPKRVIAPSLDEDAGATYESVNGSHGRSARGTPRPSLGSLIVQAGIASDRQVMNAAAEGLETGERLGEIVVRKGWATDAQVAQLLADQWRLSFLAAGRLSVDEAAAGRLSREEARALGVFPIGFDADGLVVAVVEPSLDLFEEVQQRLGDASYVVVARSALDSLLVRPVPEPGSPAAPAWHQAERAAVAAEPPAVPAGIAELAVAAIEAAMSGLERAHHDVTVLGKSLQLARDQLAEQEDELEAALERREQDAERIRRLESELSQRGDVMETLRGQVAGLGNLLGGGPA